MIAIHTTAISLPSEGKTSGSCCPKKVSSDHNTGQITLKFHFYAVWVFVNSLQKKKLKIPIFTFLTKWGGLSPLTFFLPPFQWGKMILKVDIHELLTLLCKVVFLFLRHVITPGREKKLLSGSGHKMAEFTGFFVLNIGRENLL